MLLKSGSPFTASWAKVPVARVLVPVVPVVVVVVADEVDVVVLPVDVTVDVIVMVVGIVRVLTAVVVKVDVTVLVAVVVTVLVLVTAGDPQATRLITIPSITARDNNFICNLPSKDNHIYLFRMIIITVSSLNLIRIIFKSNKVRYEKVKKL